MHDLTPDAFENLAKSIAEMNDLAVELAREIVASAGDTFDHVDDQGRLTVTLPDGSDHKVILPTDI